MDNRFLLYIDILGFKEMTIYEPRKVARVYSILNTLNAHRHPNFRTIIFSDTILVYNPDDVSSDDDRRYIVWYLTEFAEDLHRRLTGQDVFFRAVLLAGQFDHYQLERVDCFYGAALIQAYESEKGLPLIGLVMHQTCLAYNRFFRLEQFSSEYHFVYLCRNLENLEKFTGGVYPSEYTDVEDEAPHVPYDVRFLEDIYKLMRAHKSPAVRAKALTTWDFYCRRFPKMTLALVAADFSLSSLAPPGVWREEQSTMEKDIKYFKRIGSGTYLSRSLTNPRSPTQGSARPKPKTKT